MDLKSQPIALQITEHTEHNCLIETIQKFLDSIGIDIHSTTLTEDTFLPGILIQNGEIYMDRQKLLYPGDLLHEAGHLAVMKPEDRIRLSGNVGLSKLPNEAAGEELMAIAWSFAASVHLGLSPAVVFHDHGYKGQAQWYIDLFTNGTYIGLPTLQWIGLCYDDKNAVLHNAKAYPHMNKWLRE